MVHLHNHSMFSTLDGLGSIDAIVARAKVMTPEGGIAAVAVTDHASISSLTELMSECRKQGVKPIVGCEFYVVNDAGLTEKGEKRMHMTAWAKNWHGVLAIMAALTKANSQFYHRPRLSWQQALELGPDVIIGTACTHGILFDDEKAVACLEKLREVYGNDHLFLEVMPFATSEQSDVNKKAIELSLHDGYNVVATNDCHYVTRDDAKVHEVLLVIQSGSTWDDPKRWRFDADTLYMMDIGEMVKAFRALGYMTDDVIRSALTNAFRIAERVCIEMPRFEVNLPSPYEGDDNEQERVFAELVFTGWNVLKHTFKGKERVYCQRLTYEMGVIKKLNFVRYFLVVDDIIRTARSKGIMVGPARGSAAGSLVCYLLGITQVDPLKHELFFERFLNPERLDLPDIDVDFQDNRRDEVFAYIREKYGADNVANINTYSYLYAKSAFRDVCRVFGVNMLQVNLLSKQIEDAESFDKVPELVQFAKRNPEIVSYVKRLDGVIRNKGMHACGIVVSSKPLTDVAVLEKRNDSRVVNWDKVQSEEFGLVKIDVLGLTTLTVLEQASRIIKERHGVTIDFPNLTLDDPTVLSAFSRGETIGVFQFENNGMIGLLRSLNASDFETLTATTALYRPGSLNSGQTELYVKISRGDEYEHYPCDELRPILSPTKGVMVYQEQIMRIFNELGGFSWAHADKMRKIIGKKLGKDEFEKHRAAFTDGCAANNIEPTVASVLFDKMVEFAEYSFNKSHAVAYTMISYWTMYVKVYYPVEFFAAVMTHFATERLGVYAKDAARMGIAVLPPDINRSGGEFLVEDDKTIFAPLGSIKGVGDKAVEAILSARNTGDLHVFRSPEDLYGRVNRRVVNSRVIELLKRAGAFESLGIREEDPEQRNKNFCELLSFFSTLPSISGGHRLLNDMVDMFVSEVKACGHAAMRTAIPPKILGKSPAVMVINNPVKGEVEHLKNDGTKFFLDTLKNMDIDHRQFYYTSPLKCAMMGKTPSKDCEAKCLDHLRREIALVKPKLIVCFASNALRMFGREDNMGKHHGQVVYSKEFDAYVLFSRSPQFYYFGRDNTDDFFTVMQTIKEILS